MILDEALAREEPAERPDRTALNLLYMQFSEDRSDARTLFLFMDALQEYANAVARHMTSMAAGEIPRDAEWIAYGLEWCDQSDGYCEEAGEALKGIDPFDQTKAVARLRCELTPDHFARLYRTCGFEPIGVGGAE